MSLQMYAHQRRQYLLVKTPEGKWWRVWPWKCAEEPKQIARPLPVMLPGETPNAGGWFPAVFSSQLQRICSGLIAEASGKVGES